MDTQPSKRSKMPEELEPRALRPTTGRTLPTGRHGQILPPGASRRGRWRTAVTGIPAWLILGLIWWRAIVEQPDQLVVGALIWAACAVFTFTTVVGWVAWNRSLAHRRERKYGGRSGAPDGTIAYENDALGRRVVIADGAAAARHLRVEITEAAKHFKEAG